MTFQLGLPLCSLPSNIAWGAERIQFVSAFTFLRGAFLLLPDSIRFKWKEEYQEVKTMPKEEDSSITYQPEIHLGSCYLLVNARAIILTLMSFSSCKKLQHMQLNCQALQKTYPIPPLNGFIKGSAISQLYMLSIVSSVSCGDLQLYKDRWEALSIMPVLASTTLSSEKQGGT